MASREQLIATTSVELADTRWSTISTSSTFSTLWPPRSVELLGANAAGIMLADKTALLKVIASSTEEAYLLEVYELQNNKGPCPDCFHTGLPVARADLPTMHSSWPAFTPRPQATRVPLCPRTPDATTHRDDRALNLFRSEPGRLTDADLSIGQAMADIATVGLIKARAIAAREPSFQLMRGYPKQQPPPERGHLAHRRRINRQRPTPKGPAHTDPALRPSKFSCAASEHQTGAHKLILRRVNGHWRKVELERRFVALDLGGIQCVDLEVPCE
jgi:hypothetical protein